MMDGSEDNQVLASSDDEGDHPFTGFPVLDSATPQHCSPNAMVELEDDESVTESVQDYLLSEDDYETAEPTSPGH